MSTDRLMIKRDVPYSLYDVDILSATDDELKEISRSEEHTSELQSPQ